jgi:glutamyl-tRNA reductase
VKRGAPVIMVANRTFERAEALAETLGGQAVKYDRFPEMLSRADIVISSTAAPHAIIHRDAAVRAAEQRRGRPMFLIDLAVPRDIDPDVGDLDNVFLYNMDDLQVLVQRNLQGRCRHLDTVQEIVDQEAACFMQWVARLQVVPVLNELQSRLEEIRSAEWDRTERRLADLSPAEREAVDQMTRSMMRKVLHDPWRYLRTSQDDPALTEKLQALMELFALDTDGSHPYSDARETAPEPLGEARK